MKTLIRGCPVKSFVTKNRWFLPVVTLLILAVVLAAALSGCGKAESKDAQYHCPMHPTYVSDRPGDCPICGMKLVKIEKGGQHEEKAGNNAERGEPATYVCPMHPEVISDKPDECPKCGMKLAPISEQTSNGNAQSGLSHSESRQRHVLFYRNPMDPSITSPVPMKDDMGMDYVPVYSDEVQASGGNVEGLASVTLEPRALRLAGIQTAVARRELISQGIRAVGTVAPDERRIRAVHTRISGWIEKLYGNFTGQEVRAGQPILSIYSPELLASQEEFLRALEASRQLASASPEAKSSVANLLQAAGRRLELFDVPASFIAALERTGKPQRSVTLLAPTSGYVTTKDVFEGQRIEPDMELFAVTDLSRVWIETDVYEYEAPLVQVGQEASLRLPYNPSVQLRGQVSYVYPYINPETRTLKVRFEFLNPDLLLKPAMYVDVELHASEQMGIVVPESAVMDSGVRKIVFVEPIEGQFEPREVQTGVHGDGKVQIASGVQEGEIVVVKANFLLDSESRLRSAIAGMGVSGGDD